MADLQDPELLSQQFQVQADNIPALRLMADRL
jgi:hypothetical protein